MGGNLPPMLRRILGSFVALVAVAGCAQGAGDDGSRTSGYGLDEERAPEDFVTKSGAVIRCVDDARSDDGKICFEVVDGEAIIEGDISLGPAPAPGGSFPDVVGERDDGNVRVRSVAVESQSGGFLGLFKKNSRWSNAEVPYEIGTSVSDSMKKQIAIAVEKYEDQSNVHLVPRSGQSDYVVFEQTTNTCNSKIGKTGGKQVINFSATSCLLHEIGHAVGLIHEQNRPDRDKYVKVYVDRVESGFEHNFKIASNVETVGPYDFDSMMHYGAFFFADDPKLPTITRLDGTTNGLGQRTNFSAGDLAILAKLYP